MTLGREAREIRSDLAGQHQGGVDTDRGNGAEIHAHHHMESLVELFLLRGATMCIAQRFRWFWRWLQGQAW